MTKAVGVLQIKEGLRENLILGWIPYWIRGNTIKDCEWKESVRAHEHNDKVGNINKGDFFVFFFLNIFY